jgi:hypothetical protein
VSFTQWQSRSNMDNVWWTIFCSHLLEVGLMEKFMVFHLKLWTTIQNTSLTCQFLFHVVVSNCSFNKNFEGLLTNLGLHFGWNRFFITSNQWAYHWKKKKKIIIHSIEAGMASIHVHDILPHGANNWASNWNMLN